MKKQTQIKAKTINKQEKINWSLLKRIYLQGAQKISPPQPYFERNGSDHEFSGNWSDKWSEVEEHFKHILTEVYKKNQQFLNSLEDKFFKLNIDLRQRISKLEQQINFLKKGKQSYITKRYMQYQQADEQAEEYRPEINPRASFIHIEQKQQESLLQGIQGNVHSTNAKRKKTSQNQDTQQQTIKKQIIKKIYFGGQSPTKQFEQNQEQKEFKYFTSLQTSQYDKNQTTFFDKNYRDLQQQIYNLRTFIEEAHNIEIPMIDYQPSKSPQKIQSNRRKDIPEIKNAQQHLRNQNSELRLIINKYKSELVKAQYQLAEIKILLQDNLNNQFELIQI